MAVMQKGELFDPQLVTEMISKVKGRSTLAALSGADPIPFNGRKEFIFNMSDGFDIVGENKPKSANEISLTSVVINPIKMVYQARVTDEFMYAAEEARTEILRAYMDGCAAQMAKSLDIAAFHGLNPKTMVASDVIGNNYFDKKITQTVTYNATKPDDVIDSAIAVIEQAENDVTGIAITPAVRSDLAAMRNASSGTRLYPDFAFGGKPSSLGGFQLDINSTLSKGAPDVKGYMGDFKNCLRWGYAKDMTFEVIEYGDPDNTNVDLKGSNQVCLRTEVYLGWGILIPEAFVRIVVTGVTLDKHQDTVKVGATTTLTATTVPANATVTWTSSDATVATVASGVVTGVKAGEATITASVTVDGLTYTDKCVVTVSSNG